MQAKIYNHKKWISETKDTVLKKKFDNLLQKSGFQILNFSDYHFDPYGYTALWLLGESHFTIHTFPEENKTYIELSSCNFEYFKNFIETL